MKAFLALIALVLLVPFSAVAHYDAPWQRRAFGYEVLDDVRPYRRHRHHYSRPRYEREAPRRYRDEEYGYSALCLDIQRNVGDERPDEDEAKFTASRRWAALVRFHHGEKFMDLNHARDIRYVCTRSSVHDMAPTERYERDERDERYERGERREPVGRLHMRCEIVARPCPAPIREDEKRQ